MLGWSLLFGLACALAASSCFIPFDDYIEADVCEAARDAGLDPKNADDPVLRACDAGQPPSATADANAGAAGMQESP